MTQHTFIGIPLGEVLREEGAVFQEEFEMKGYFRQLVFPEDIHLTLLFFGGAPAGEVQKIWEAVKERTGHFPSFSLTMEQLNVFGNPERPRVIFLEPAQNPVLNELAHIVRNTAGDYGLPVESRPFRPHITLAKKWKDKEVRFNPPFQPVRIRPISKEVCQLSLFTIHPGRRPKYEAADTIKLKEC